MSKEINYGDYVIHKENGIIGRVVRFMVDNQAREYAVIETESKGDFHDSVDKFKRIRN